MYQIEGTTVDLSQPCHGNIADKGIAAKSKRSLAYSIPKSQTTREGDGRLEDDPWSTSSRLQEKWRRVRAGEIGGAGEAETRRKTCQFVGCWSYVSATRRKYAPLPFPDATLAEGGRGDFRRQPREGQIKSTRRSACVDIRGWEVRGTKGETRRTTAVRR